MSSAISTIVGTLCPNRPDRRLGIGDTTGIPEYALSGPPRGKAGTGRENTSRKTHRSARMSVVVYVVWIVADQLEGSVIDPFEVGSDVTWELMSPQGYEDYLLPYIGEKEVARITHTADCY